MEIMEVEFYLQKSVQNLQLAIESTSLRKH